MPELPEVETIRRDLEHEAVGKQITDVRINGARTVRRHGPRVLVNKLCGRTIIGFRRKGKYLIADLDDGISSLVVLLRMSGQLLWQFGAQLRKHTHARIYFDTGEELHFVDPRTFGELWITTSDLPELAHMGPDAFTDLDFATLRKQLCNRHSRLKTLLLNQQVISGIGNIYSDEILWSAKLRYDRISNSLSQAEMKRLHKAIHEVLLRSIDSRGSTLSDAQYVDLYGNGGGDQHRHHVYAREGEECDRCGGVIERVKVGGRSCYFCPQCQR